MRVELYIDVFFFVNFVMDFLLLRLSAGILKKKVSPRRTAAAGAAGAAAACAVLWIRILLPENAVFRHLGGPVSIAGPAAILCAAAFAPRSVRELLKEMLLLFFLAGAAGGFMEFLLEYTGAGYLAAMLLRGEASAGLSFFMWVFLVCGSVFLFRYLWMTVTETRREREALCPVTLSVGDRSLQVTAYRDSGNMLTEPESGRPVSIVSERVWLEVIRAAEAQNKEMRVIHIRYRTIGSPLGVMEAAQIDSLELYLRPGADEHLPPDPESSAAGTERELLPWIARAPFPLSGEGSYEMLLHRDL